MTVKVRFDGRVFIPEVPVDLPEGVYEVAAIRPVAPAKPESPAEERPSLNSEERPLLKLLELLDQFPKETDLPPDAAAQHDHYLYGLPKRP